MREEAYKIKINGDSGLSIVFGQGISVECNRKVHAFAKQLKAMKIKGILSIIPSYCELLIVYKPLLLSYETIYHKLKAALKNLQIEEETIAEVVYIPVLYGGLHGCDLDSLAQQHNISTEKVIQLHTAPYYRIYMLGFKPGFPYLAGMDKELVSSRLSSPRLSVAAGSVGIAGEQTGIYPQDSPGGWQLIGHTPLNLIDWTCDEINLLKPGQYIKFYSVDQANYNQIKSAVEVGCYKAEIRQLKEVAL